MCSKKIDFGGSKDSISNLPDSLSCHILSFLPTKEAVSTSILSKRWNNLFALLPNLEFDDSMYMQPRVSKQKKRFMDFVDSVLALQGNNNTQLNRFYLKCRYVDDPYLIFEWIPKVLERGVSDLDLYISSEWDHCSEAFPLPSEIFVSKTLVRLSIRVRDSVTIDVEDDISLPKLKTLHLDNFSIEENSLFAKLLSGCTELGELILFDLMWDSEEPFSLSTTTLKRLKFCVHDSDEYRSIESMSFDIPNLIYLEYTDSIAVKYPQVCFDSLVEASLGLRLTSFQIKRIRYAEDVEAETDGEMIIGDVTNFLIGICNVKILYLSHQTVEVLNYCCKTVPIFENLNHLTIETHQEVGWRSLSALLNNCPNLETLIFKGLYHKVTEACGNEDDLEMCLCKYDEDKEEIDVPTCLSSSPVKVLKVLKFGEIFEEYEKFVIQREQMKQVMYFLETMPNLEEMILYYDTSNDEDVIKVSSLLQRLSKVASSKCKVQVISDNLNLSSTIPSSALPFKTDDLDSLVMDMFPDTRVSSWKKGLILRRT